MQTSFDADYASSETAMNVLHVGVRGGDHYLVFQRDLDDSDPKQIYLEYDDQGYGGYDAVSHCSLTRGQLVITLSKQLEFLEETREFAIPLALDDDSFNEFRSGLSQLFDVAPELLTGVTGRPQET